jgi:hypothetical protein
MSNIDVSHIRENAHSAYRRDGIGHLMAGLSLGLVGLFFFDHRQAWAIFWAIGIWYWIGETLRRRLTYPRLGHAKLPADRRAAALTGLAIVVIVALAVVIDRSSHSAWATVYWAIVLAAAAAGFACTRRSPLYAGLALACLASGLVARWLASTGISSHTLCAYQFWGLAAVLLVVGGTQLLLFLLRTPVPR